MVRSCIDSCNRHDLSPVQLELNRISLVTAESLEKREAYSRSRMPNLEKGLEDRSMDLQARYQRVDDRLERLEELPSPAA